jgi:flagellar hook assembly protein FlgD
MITEKTGRTMFDEDMLEVQRDCAAMTGITDTITLEGGGEYIAIVDDEGHTRDQEQFGQKEEATVTVTLWNGEFLNEENWPKIKTTFTWSRDNKRYQISRISRDWTGTGITIEGTLANRSAA